MATTYYALQIITPKASWTVGPGHEFTSAVITYPASATPYFIIQLVRPDATDIYVEGTDVVIVRP